MLEQQRKRVRRKPGQIFEVRLGNDAYCYGLVLREPLMAFYDRLFPTQRSPEDVKDLPIAFTIMVMNSAITSGHWPVVGNAPIPESMLAPPKFCNRDSVSGEIMIYHEVPELAPHYERPAAPGECNGLETAAVWEPEHVEDRLRDHFAGRPNVWVEQLRVREGQGVN